VARRASAAWAVLSTPYGRVLVRPLYAAKQRTWVLVLDGPPEALHLLEFRPHAISKTSHRRHLTPPVPAPRVNDLRPFYAQRKASWDAVLGGGRSAATPAPASTLFTVGELAGWHLEQMRSRVRPSSLKTYRLQWQTVHRYLPASLLLLRLDKPRIGHALTAMTEDGLSASSARNVLGMLRRALALARAEGHLIGAPLTSLPLPSVVERARPTLSVAHLTAVLDATRERSWDLHVAIALAALAGLRRAEALALTWTDIHLQSRCLVVRNSRTFTTKSGKSRTIPIADALLAILNAARERRPDHIAPTDYVVRPDLRPSGRSQRWNLRTAFATALRRAQVPSIPYHSLRRTFATRAVEHGVPISKVKLWLGHASVTVTETYVQHAQGFDPEVNRVLAGTD
jgi:integrase